MEIKEITTNKKNYMEILLIGDEEARMINKYIDEGNLFVLYDKNELKSACVALRINKNTIEIKNLATYPDAQKNGYATSLLRHVCTKYKHDTEYLILGTGNNEETLTFYKKRGFEEIYRIKDFFIKNYSKIIYENGQQLTDMIYLQKKLVEL